MNDLVEEIVAAMAEAGKTHRIAELIITHEAFDAIKAQQNAGEVSPMIELRHARYWFGAVPITRVTDLPEGAQNPHYVISVSAYGTPS